MDKQRKLRRYRQKDYTLLVGFPVEIVGRNGVVRSYSFEDSVKLYQRRIASAATRYHDDDIVQAEIGHCLRRIKQLRRSFLERYGWGSIKGLSGPEAAGGEMAAELAAFLRRFEGSLERARRWSIELVDRDDHRQLYFLRRTEEQPRLLYLFHFATRDPGCSARQELDRLRASLQHAAAGDQAEHLHALHRTADCAMLLTGREAPAASATREFKRSGPRHDLDAPADTPIARAGAALRAGDATEALGLLEGLLASSPYHRHATLLAAHAAETQGATPLAEFYARLGCAHHPQDAVLHHQLGVYLLRQKRVHDARQAFGKALDLEPRLFATRVLLALLALHLKRHADLERLLGEQRAVATAGQEKVFRTVRHWQTRERWRRWSLVLVLPALFASATWLVLGLPLALPCLAVVLGFCAVLFVLLRRPRPLVTAMEVTRRLQVPSELLPAHEHRADMDDGTGEIWPR